MADRMRASDAEREQTVAALRHAVGEGRLDMEEFTERTTQAYLAKTRGELLLLLEDLPTGAPNVPAPAAYTLPEAPGFQARWRVPARREQAAIELTAFVAPPMGSHGFRLERQTPSHLVFSRRHRPVWTYVVTVLLFPVGALALLHTQRREVVFELAEQDGQTQITASGDVPGPLRRALNALG